MAAYRCSGFSVAFCDGARHSTLHELPLSMEIERLWAITLVQIQAGSSFGTRRNIDKSQNSGMSRDLFESDYFSTSFNECIALWLLKNSLSRKCSKKLCARIPYKRLSTVLRKMEFSTATPVIANRSNLRDNLSLAWSLQA
jgi:hypothetical protein